MIVVPFTTTGFTILNETDWPACKLSEDRLSRSSISTSVCCGMLPAWFRCCANPSLGAANTRTSARSLRIAILKPAEAIVWLSPAKPYSLSKRFSVTPVTVFCGRYQRNKQKKKTDEVDKWCRYSISTTTQKTSRIARGAFPSKATASVKLGSLPQTGKIITPVQKMGQKLAAIKTLVRTTSSQ